MNMTIEKLLAITAGNARVRVCWSDGTIRRTIELDIPKKKVLAAKKVKDLVDLILDEADEDDIREALGESSSDEEPDEDEEDEVDYSEMSLSELKAECKDRGLKVKKGMDKDDLIELLEEDDEEG